MLPAGRRLRHCACSSCQGAAESVGVSVGLLGGRQCPMIDSLLRYLTISADRPPTHDLPQRRLLLRV